MATATRLSIAPGSTQPYSTGICQYIVFWFLFNRFYEGWFFGVRCRTFDNLLRIRLAFGIKFSKSQILHAPATWHSWKASPDKCKLFCINCKTTWPTKYIQVRIKKHTHTHTHAHTLTHMHHGIDKLKLFELRLKKFCICEKFVLRRVGLLSFHCQCFICWKL